MRFQIAAESGRVAGLRAFSLTPAATGTGQAHTWYLAGDCSRPAIKMEKIAWKPEYSVGIERLDQQHQRIISVINELIEKPRVFRKSGTIADVLAQLNSYVSEHFLLEEQLLEENNYPDLIGHSKRHTEYGERIAEFCLKSVAKDKNVPEELLSYLGAWWIGHILHEDMKYKGFLAGKGIR